MRCILTSSHLGKWQLASKAEACPPETSFNLMARPLIHSSLNPVCADALTYHLPPLSLAPLCAYLFAVAPASKHICTSVFNTMEQLTPFCLGADRARAVINSTRSVSHSISWLRHSIFSLIEPAEASLVASHTRVCIGCVCECVRERASLFVCVCVCVIDT